MKKYIVVDERITTETHCLSIAEIRGTIMGTAGLTRLPVDELAVELAGIIKSVSPSTRLIIEPGKDIAFSRREKITQREIPSENIFRIDQIERTAECFGISGCEEGK